MSRLFLTFPAVALLFLGALFSTQVPVAHAQTPTPPAGVLWDFENGTQQGWVYSNRSGLNGQTVSVVNGDLYLPVTGFDDAGINHWIEPPVVTATVTINRYGEGAGNDKYALSLYTSCDGETYSQIYNDTAWYGWGEKTRSLGVLFPECMLSGGVFGIRVRQGYDQPHSYRFRSIQISFGGDVTLSTETENPAPEFCDYQYEFLDTEGFSQVQGTPGRFMWQGDETLAPYGFSNSIRLDTINQETVAATAALPLPPNQIYNIDIIWRNSGNAGGDNTSSWINAICDGAEFGLIYKNWRYVASPAVAYRGHAAFDFASCANAEILFRNKHNYNVGKTTWLDELKIEPLFCPVASGQWDVEPPPPPPPPGETCDLLPNADFNTADDWALFAGASITTSTLTLPRDAYAEQQPGLDANTSYQAVISVTNVANGPTTLRLSLDQSYKLLSVSEAGVYTTQLQALSGSETYRIMNEPPVMSFDDPVVDIGFTCLTATGLDSGCIAPDNGTFDDDSAWSWSHGGQWNANEQNALLPLETEGIVSQDMTVPVLPNVSGGNYWVLSFDARGKYSDAVAYTSLTGPDFTDSLTITLGTAFQSYEIDASAYQESTTGIYFANFASEGSTADIFIDNVCLRWSADPPTDLPPPKGPPQVRPVPTITLTIDVECAEVSQVLSDTVGIDFVALESTTIPADWTDLGGWFYWLGSRLWVYVAKPIICALLFLWNLLAGILETIVNFVIENVVNPFLEQIANPAMLWLYGIYAALIAFLLDPFGQLASIARQIWDEIIYPALEPWIEWLQQLWDEHIWPVLEPFLQPLIDLWTWVDETLWPWLQELWDDPFGTLDALISDMLQALANVFKWFFQPFYDLLMWLRALLILFLGPVAMLIEIVYWPVSFVLAVIVGVYGDIANPPQLPPLELGEYAEGYSLMFDTLAGTPLGTGFVLVINGIIWWKAIRWALEEFATFNT